ncbi:MAG: trehalose-6-phosphate synthase [Myxococcota bacterium]
MAQQTQGDQRLLVVTNRLPFAFQRGPNGLERRHAAGGLATALDPLMRRQGGTWLGWPGIELRPGERLDLRDAPYGIVPLTLTDTEFNRYYHGLSNRGLWPLFHAFPSRTRFDRRDWPVYRQVNKRFAKLALRSMREGDLVWVHDYHLMLTPAYLRRSLSEARIAFFLHIPFPHFDVFRLLPWTRELLRGLLACNLVGFHVEAYARNFLDCAERLLDAEVDWKNWRVRSAAGETQVGAFPIGIDFESFDSRIRGNPPLEGKREGIVIGADRLDYTKGIPERILAFERLIEKYPEHRENVVLLQVAVPSRHQVAEYRTLKREIEELVGRVNGRFGTAGWTPIRYLYRLLDHDRLSMLYRDADVGLVTPLRDGMNLVAKEFVACQPEDDPGVLVLSRLAGAAETMRESLLVNPYHIEKTADQIHRALTLPEEERRLRMKSLRSRERRNDVHAWVASFLAAAGAGTGAS